jgi:hypothetical protein
LLLFILFFFDSLFSLSGSLTLSSLRVLNFAVYYHGIEQQSCKPPPPPPPLPSNPEKTTAPTSATGSISMSEQELNVVALALAYHDIGLWTDGGALSYLEPSVAVLEREIPVVGQKKKTKLDKQQTAWAAAASLPAFTEADLATACEIVLQHHKFTSWQPPSPEKEQDPSTEKAIVAADAALVNAVRRADWADATMGIVKSGMSPIYLETIYNTIPPLGFHAMLLGMCNRLSPNSLVGQLNVLQILKW